MLFAVESEHIRTTYCNSVKIGGNSADIRTREYDLQFGYEALRVALAVTEHRYESVEGVGYNSPQCKVVCRRLRLSECGKSPRGAKYPLQEKFS